MSEFSNFFGSLRIGQRMFIALASVLVALLVVVVMVLSSIAILRQRQQDLYVRDMQSMQDLVGMRNNINRMQSDIYLMLLTDTPEIKAKSLNEIKGCTEQVLGIFPQLKERYNGDSTKLEQINKLEGAIKSYVSERDEELIPLIHQRALEDAKTLIFGIQRENLKTIDEVSEELKESALKAVSRQLQEAQQIADNATISTIFFSALAAILAGITCWSLVRNLTSATTELHEAVTVLGDGVQQILASVAESASGTSETASAVTQTTATVEQLKQTSRLSSERAKGVFESSQRSEEISSTGLHATEETAAGMKRIRKEMDEIAQGMRRLNEKARDIVEIIATVDDLAKQSNLLAVNAAIEAAKAGEHGKGFAVVAQEVKNMAAQSKHATAQVRAIVEEIQAAASLAAQATELGSQAVDSAVKQSNQANESIMQLANSVSESATAAAQIASASKQQEAGADQVAVAMLGIKQAAEDNVSAIGRVEEAATILNSLGLRLQDLVKRY